MTSAADKNFRPPNKQPRPHSPANSQEGTQTGRTHATHRAARAAPWPRTHTPARQYSSRAERPCSPARRACPGHCSRRAASANARRAGTRGEVPCRVGSGRSRSLKWQSQRGRCPFLAL